MPRRNEEDLLNPDRAYFRLIRDYVDGHLTKPWLKLYRARVEEVSRVRGDLEQNPPNPPNSVRARVYSSALDANIPSNALTIFHPLLPGHLSPTIEQGEHVYVVFEDQNYSHGLWISQISSYHELNNSDPDIRDVSETNSSYAFEGDQQSRTVPPAAYRYGGATTETQGRQEMAANFESASDEVNPWRGKRVIMIGDSMVGGATKEDGRRQGQGPCPFTLGRILVSDYEASFFRALGRVGWGVENWLSGRFDGQRRGLSIPQPSISDLKNQYRADIVLVILGGNDAGRRGSRSDYESKVRQLWDEARSGIDFAIWCGPPSISPNGSAVRRRPNFNNERDLVNDKIRSTVGDSNFIDCRALTASPEFQSGRDQMGIHWGSRNRIGTPWAQLFIEKARNL